MNAPRPPTTLLFNLLLIFITLTLCFLIFTKKLTFALGGQVLNLGLPQATAIGFIVFALPLLLFRSNAFVAFVQSIDSDSPRKEDRSLLALILLCLVLTGFSLRFANLHEYGLMPDEALFIYASSQRTFLEVLRDLSVHFHPPANFTMLFLQLKLSWNPTWLRMGSVLGGTYLIGISYAVGRQLFSRSAGLVMAIVVTFSPTLILLSRVCRNYTPGLAFLFTALFFLLLFFHNGRWRHFYAFAVFEFFASTWNYIFIVVLLGLNLAVFAFLSIRRRPAADWFKAIAAQLPVGLLFIEALLVHLPRTTSGETEKIVGYMVDEFTISGARIFHPVASLIRYLIAPRDDISSLLISAAFFGFFLIGIPVLWLRGKRWQLLLCLAPLPFAYWFAFAQKQVAFGGTRHAMHLFPFIFAIVGAQASELVHAYRGISLRTQEPPTESAVRPSDSPSRWGTIALGIICLAFVQNALCIYAYERPYELRQWAEHLEERPFYKGKFYKVPEAPTRTDDLERVWQTLKREVGPNDVVMVSYQGLLLLRFHVERPHQPMAYSLDKLVSFSREGVDFYYSPNSGWAHTPETLMKSVADARRHFGIEKIEKVWVAQAGWEIWASPVAGWIERVYPEMLLDTPAVRESRGLVFALDGPAALLEGDRLLQADALEGGRRAILTGPIIRKAL